MRACRAGSTATMTTGVSRSGSFQDERSFWIADWIRIRLQLIDAHIHAELSGDYAHLFEQYPD